MLKYFWYSFIIIGLSSCRAKTPVITERQLVTKIHLDSLVVKDLSEDMSRISTQEDEIFLFTFLHQNNEILRVFKTPQLIFTKRELKFSINHLLMPSEETNRCTFFLVELDHESLPHAVDSLLIDWVRQPSFPANFNLFQADSLLGDDDLLGMQSYLTSDLPGLSPLVFSGRQLFDRFVYELYFRSE